MEVAGLERGEIVRVKNDFAGTRPITDALRFLIDRHVSMTHAVGGNATEMRMIVGDNAKRFASMIEKDAARERVLRKACSSIAEAAADSDRSMRSLASSLTSIDDILAELRTTASTDAEMVKTQAAIRRQFDSAIHKLRDVGEQSLAITHVAKAVQDLAKRSKMIALNTTIQAGDESSCGLATLTQEIVSLSERAEKANKAIAGIGDSIVRDVNQANASVQWLTTEVAKVSARSARTEESLLLLSDNLSPLAGVSKRVETEGAAALARLDDGSEMLTDCVNRSEDISSDLRACEASLTMLREPIDAIGTALGLPGRDAGVSVDGSTPAPGRNGTSHAPQKHELVTMAGEK